MGAADRTSTPFENRVPREMRANLRWRAAVHKRVMEDPEFAEVIREACSRDFIFWLAGFVWTYDPRREPFPKLPFIPYPFQEEAAMEILAVMGVEDLLIVKSRDMGATCLLIAVYTWMWIYYQDQSFLLVSRVEDYVDKTGNPKTLFWKMDFIIDNLPHWLKPKGYDGGPGGKHRHSMHAENPETGAVIDGESTNKRVARGDRRTSIMLDEFAAVETGTSVLSATRDATNCRIFNSTPEGINNAFFDIHETNIRKLRLHWTSHPLKAVGLYSKDGGSYVAVDTDYWGEINDPRSEMERYDRMILDRGVPLPDDKERSPWYANECARAGSAQEIAQELDIDFLGSGHQYFSPDAIAKAIRNYARPPTLVGDLEYDDLTAEPIRFRENPGGKLKLWFFLNRNGEPTIEGRPVMGVDVSAGTGASNSVIAAWNSITMEKIAQYTNAHIRPEQFAKQAVAIARWVGKAFMIWEAQGVGRQFGSRVIDLSYRNIYYRKRNEAICGAVSDIPGWASTKEGRNQLLGNYRAMVEDGDCVNRDRQSLEETLEYVFGPDTYPVHARSNDKKDPSGAKTNHGDRVFADALAMKALGERTQQPASTKPEVPYGCLAWRNERREEANRAKEDNLGPEWN